MAVIFFNPKSLNYHGNLLWYFITLVKTLIWIYILVLFCGTLLIRHLPKLKTVLFLHRYLISAVLFWYFGRHDNQHINIHHNDTQHNNKYYTTLSIMTLYIIAESCYVECHMLSVIMLNVIILRGIILSVVAPIAAVILY